ncbi:MAG: Extensin family protein [Variovorax sp.]|nr:Extensin family protein [Variovorax sp.]
MPAPIVRPPPEPSPPPPSGARHGKWLGLALCAVIAAGAYAFWRGAIALPERFNPWAPLDVAAPPNLLTGFKLARAQRSGTLPGCLGTHRHAL